MVAGNGKGGLPTPGPADSSELAGPEGVAVDAHGDLFIADFLNNVVEEVTPAWRLSVVAGGGARRPGAQALPPAPNWRGLPAWRWTATGTCSSPTLQTMS